MPSTSRSSTALEQGYVDVALLFSTDPAIGRGDLVEVGTERWERPERLPPDLRTTRADRFAGACVTYALAFAGDAPASLTFAADQALALQPRQELVDEVRDRTGLALCGAGAPCPP